MVVDSKYYELLGLSPSCDDSDIRKAYKKAALKYHPDKNPSPEAKDKFNEISKAYEVLSDPEKREYYDNYGPDAMEGSGMGQEFSAEDLFANLFMGGMGTGRPEMFEGGRDIAYPLPVTLEEMYIGKETKVDIVRDVLCSQCDGSGGKSGPGSKCKECNGKGEQNGVQQVFPGLYQNISRKCRKCAGSGIKEKDRCKKCGGAKVMEERKSLTVHIDRGAQDGEKIVLRGEGSKESSKGPAGDVIIRLRQIDHPKFDRFGNDLKLNLKISLREALCGFSRKIQHLDDTFLNLSNYPSTDTSAKIITPGTTKKIIGHGFIQKKTLARGDLYVHFDIEFPDPEKWRLSESDRKVLWGVLPGTQDEEVEGGAGGKSQVKSTPTTSNSATTATGTVNSEGGQEKKKKKKKKKNQQQQKEVKEDDDVTPMDTDSMHSRKQSISEKYVEEVKMVDADGTFFGKPSHRGGDNHGGEYDDEDEWEDEMDDVYDDDDYDDDDEPDRCHQQ